jgi:multimeric flavodoxin WrbA
VLGSPRHSGNSAIIAGRFIETARSLGADVRTYELNRLNYRGCQGCCACKTTHDYCVQKDDLTEVLKAIREKEADVYLVTVPVYAGSVPGQFKCFTDRGYGFLVSNYRGNPDPSRVSPGKKGVLIVTQGGPEGAFKDLVEREVGRMKRQWKLDEVHVIHAFNVGAGGIPIGVPDKFLQQAEELARVIVT